MKGTRHTDSNPIRIFSLTPSRWADLEKLFGPRGACAGCWCMYWRLAHSDFKKKMGAANKRAFKKIVAAGETLVSRKVLRSMVNCMPVRSSSKLRQRANCSSFNSAF